MPSLLAILLTSLVLLFCVWASHVSSFTPSFTKTGALSRSLSLSPASSLCQRIGGMGASLCSAASRPPSKSCTDAAAPAVFPATFATSATGSAASPSGRVNPEPYGTSAAAPRPSLSNLRTFHSSAGLTVSLRNPSSLHSSSAATDTWRDAGEISSLTSSTATPVFGIEKIRQILPHRFPFLLVDKVLSFEAGKRAVGVKQVTANEDQFNGHFPSRSILPGVLQVEALAQLAGIIALQPPISEGKGDFFFAGVNGVRWKKPVVPGDTLVMEVELTTWKEKLGIAKAKGKGYVDGKPAVEVEEMIFALVRPS